MRFASSSYKINSKFKISGMFAVVKANSKCEAATGFTEYVKTAFAHLDFPLIIFQCSISTMITMPKVLNSLPFISDSLASFNPLKLTKITLVLFVNAELNNKLSIANPYLYRLYLSKKLFTSLPFILISAGFNLSYLSKFEACQLLFDQWFRKALVFYCLLYFSPWLLI